GGNYSPTGRRCPRWRPACLPSHPAASRPPPRRCSICLRTISETAAVGNTARGYRSTSHALLVSAATPQGTDEHMDEGKSHQAAAGLLAAPPRVINIGLELFADDLASQGAQVVHVPWSPPAGGNSQLADLPAKLPASPPPFA